MPFTSPVISSLILTQLFSISVAENTGRLVVMFHSVVLSVSLICFTSNLISFLQAVMERTISIAVNSFVFMFLFLYWFICYGLYQLSGCRVTCVQDV